MNPEPGVPTEIDIGGKLYQIRFSLGTLKKLQHDHGISLLRGTGAGDTLTDPEKLAIVLYHGLRDRNPDITLEWVEENVEASTLLAMIPSLSKAISGRAASIPNALPPEALSGTGLSSGASDDMTSGLVNGRSGA